ncbi:SDR family NAD(P)-dependent oxidoreductase [Cumulibacter soli]|uniref:SDR family NAD(P)-dependent oxidoreductase n=1 Tax=Cumulibacter soli TaxID=2546344 RepID=UPI0010683B69|nr:SDR family oxidoreductase [Cumulibacter soli]
MTEPPMSTDLTGLTATVTGAGSAPADVVGNGRAVATLLARRGANVVAVDRDASRVEDTASYLNESGGSCLPLVGDVTDDAFCREISERAVAEYGAVNMLFNNVGVGGPQGTVVNVDLEKWRRTLDVNVTSMLLTSRYAIPKMVAAGGGAIVNMSSAAGLVGGHAHIAYAVTKGAIVNMTRAMAAQHGADGIRVNCVAPGMAYTAMVASQNMTTEMREARRQRSMLQTEGTPWDVAETVVFLLSPAAKWTTGVTVPVDAGRTAGERSNPVFVFDKEISS